MNGIGRKVDQTNDDRVKPYSQDLIFRFFVTVKNRGWIDLAEKNKTEHTLESAKKDEHICGKNAYITYI